MKMPPPTDAARLDARDERYLRLMGQFINERRCFLNMSQEQLALVSGLSRTEIHNLEHGLTSSKVTTMIRVCEALDMSNPELVAHMESLMAHPKRDASRRALKTRCGAKR